MSNAKHIKGYRSKREYKYLLLAIGKFVGVFLLYGIILLGLVGLLWFGITFLFGWQ